jgi:hypothetical protein
MKSKTLFCIALIISSFLFFAAISVEAADTTINDPTGDVASMDFMGNTTYVTSNPYVSVDGLDILQITYTKNGGTATVTMQVKGSIIDRGNINDLSMDNPEKLLYDVVGYELDLTTSTETYQIAYVNTVCQLTDSDYTTINLTTSDYSVNGDTLTVTISLKSADETYESLEVSSQYNKIDFSGFDENSPDPDELDDLLVMLVDQAPNPPIQIYEVYVQNIASPGETVQFNGSVFPLTGTPPYQYHWDFGDGKTSSEQNPTHSYTKAGTYEYNFTITDNLQASASQNGTITVAGNSNDGGTTISTQMILLLAILVIIIAVGIVIIVWIIRR